MARYEPVQFERLTPEYKALYENVRGKRPKLVGPFSVLMHNPALAAAVSQVVDVVRKDGKLEKRLYELIVLIVVRHWQAAYAWAVHDPLGRAAGLPGDVVDALQAQRKPALAKPDEQAIYEAITELLDNKKISDGAYRNLVKQIGFDNALEAVACAGLYCMIGFVINAFEVPTPNGEKPF
ncbi:MAG: 4-carboxymuconolactone decarboxylase [Alphaproteobacteria bacterium]|nr:4-carboxymuconolactone decarboxylase [Alphaproteobacteria bacterium]